jgi:flagellar basal body-associated protein FliL
MTNQSNKINKRRRMYIIIAIVSGIVVILGGVAAIVLLLRPRNVVTEKDTSAIQVQIDEKNLQIEALQAELRELENALAMENGGQQLLKLSATQVSMILCGGVLVGGILIVLLTHVMPKRMQASN